MVAELAERLKSAIFPLITDNDKELNHANDAFTGTFKK